MLDCLSAIATRSPLLPILRRPLAKHWLTHSVTLSKMSVLDALAGLAVSPPAIREDYSGSACRTDLSNDRPAVGRTARPGILPLRCFAQRSVRLAAISEPPSLRRHKPSPSQTANR